ncbi:hypothetical protein RAS1_43340 [Phycisphaerae bacterium RAS1]|nr:hypothetical protein RAS1_43340 [Phycisphaerae bacterium RAS1]
MPRIRTRWTFRKRRGAESLALGGFLLAACLLAGCDDGTDALVPRIRSVRVFAFEERRGERYNEQTIRLCPVCILPDDMVAASFPQARPVPHAFYDRGNHFAIATLDDGREVRMTISAYGAMFRFAGGQRVYRMEGEARAAIDPHLDAAFREMADWPK